MPRVLTIERETHQLAERERVDLYAFKIETEPPLGNFRLVLPHVPREGTIENHLFRKKG
jgi:hypothetical protein